MPPEFGRKWGTECLKTLGSLCLPCCVRGDGLPKFLTRESDWVVAVAECTKVMLDDKIFLAHRFGAKARRKVRTMASILVNGFHEGLVINRITVDEALIKHFGAIVMADRLLGAREVTLIGDINQLPYIVYYSDDNGDAIGKFISRAVGASSAEVPEANNKEAMSQIDNRVIEALL